MTATGFSITTCKPPRWWKDSEIKTEWIDKGDYQLCKMDGIYRRCVACRAPREFTKAAEPLCCHKCKSKALAQVARQDRIRNDEELPRTLALRLAEGFAALRLYHG